MSNQPPAPRVHEAFVTRFPELGRAWEAIGEAGRRGPLDQRTALLLKLAISIGALREGAVHAAVRKAVAAGVDRESIDQVIALAASTLGLPATVAVFSWIGDIVAPESAAKPG
jgi:alkylhydroperoxidase/carboxymuconolactone decarboxylase family protein YurZ